MIRNFWRKTIVTTIIITVLSSNLYTVLAAKTTTTGTSNSSTHQTTLETAGEDLATWAENFANNHKWDCIYDVDLRGATYRGDITGYYFDCVGWVAYALNRAIGIYNQSAYNGSGGPVIPSQYGDNVNTNNFVQSYDMSQARRGDILIAPGHVAIYLGNGKVVDMWSTGDGRKTSQFNGLEIRDLNGWTMADWSGCTFTSFARIVSLDGIHFLEDAIGNSDFTLLPPNPDTPLPGSVEYSGQDLFDWISNVVEGILLGHSSERGTTKDTSSGGSGEVDLDQIAEEMKIDGMPPDVVAGGDVGMMYYLSGVGDLFDYIIGLMFNGIKIVTVTIGEGIQGMVTGALDFLSGKTEEDGAAANSINK